jgi:hypothetical protein
MTMGNEDNLEKIQELMKQQALAEQAEQIHLGGNLKNGTYIDFESDFGTKFQGWVEFKRPTTFEYMQMGGKKSEYLRKAGVKDVNLVDNSVKTLAHCMAVLATVVTKCPEWLLDIEEVKEPEVLYHVYAQYEVWENSFRKKFEPEGDSPATK